MEVGEIPKDCYQNIGLGPFGLGQIQCVPWCHLVIPVGQK